MSVYLICYVLSWLSARLGHYYISGMVLIFAAVCLFLHDYKKSRNPIHLRALFSLFWVGGQGISCLKLSSLQKDWSLMTWVCFLAAFVGFWITFEIIIRMTGGEEAWNGEWRGFRGNHTPVVHGITAITLISLTALCVEAGILGFVPLFVRGVPHAYSAFHISGLHYFTVSCVLVPSLSVLYYSMSRKRTGLQNGIVNSMTITALLIPILCVSRFQLILAVAMAAFTYIALQKRFELLYALGLILAMIPFYVGLTFARSHSVSYLNGIFAMKNSRMPIFITQPYMYIANNYDNFNCLVEQLPAHTFGLRMLFPLWAFTGLKFIKPELVNFPIYVTKEELTTVTLFYDAYYDFGLAGVVVFSCLLGAVSWLLVRQLRKTRNAVGFLVYAQIALYLVFSFFTTWFSNPTTWFYLGATVALYFYYYWKTS